VEPAKGRAAARRSALSGQAARPRGATPVSLPAGAPPRPAAVRRLTICPVDGATAPQDRDAGERRQNGHHVAWRRVGAMPTAKSRKREAARGISEVERSSRRERFWRDPSGQRPGTAVRAFSGVATAARRDMMPVPTPAAEASQWTWPVRGPQRSAPLMQGAIVPALISEFDRRPPRASGCASR
jgi:hypothetical protein